MVPVAREFVLDFVESPPVILRVAFVTEAIGRPIVVPVVSRVRRVRARWKFVLPVVVLVRRVDAFRERLARDSAEYGAGDDPDQSAGGSAEWTSGNRAGRGPHKRCTCQATGGAAGDSSTRDAAKVILGLPRLWIAIEIATGASIRFSHDVLLRAMRCAQGQAAVVEREVHAVCRNRGRQGLRARLHECTARSPTERLHIVDCARAATTAHYGHGTPWLHRIVSAA